MPTINAPIHGDDVCIFPCGFYYDWRELSEVQRVQGDFIRLPVDTEIWTRFLDSDCLMTYDEVVLALSHVS